MALVALPFVRSRAGWREVDWPGAVSLAAGVVPLLVALSITNQHSWTSPQVLGLLTLAALALLAFFWIERRAAQPIVPFELFGGNVFAVSVVIAFTTSLALFGSIIYVPLLYQGVLGISATGSGQLLTPMVLGLIVFSTLSGQLMTRIRRYRYLGTVGVAAAATGIWLLARVTVGTPGWEVARDIAVIGAGLGLTMPLTINAVQSAVPRRFLGVASSQVQFWRNLGGTIGTAVLGSILARQLPGAIQAQIAALHLPAGAPLPGALSGGSPQALFDPANLARARATLPPGAGPVFEELVAAARLGLASALHDVFLMAAGLILVGLLATLFLREVPLRRGAAAAGPAGRAGRDGEGVERPRADRTDNQQRPGAAITGGNDGDR